jgi:hypothetical protein
MRRAPLLPKCPAPSEEDHMVETIPMPSVGDPAPSIEAQDTQGQTFKLSDRLGSWVVVYFYPRANTPG